MNPTLHYIFDPLCGWCYGAAPLVEAAQDVPGLRIALHAGGMLTGPNRRGINEAWRQYVLPHDRRIAQLSGQPFGEGYFEGLLRDHGAVMDSEPPITAVLAAQALGGRGLDMLHGLQRAHYVDGRRIAERAVLVGVAAETGLDAAAFDEAYERCGGEPTAQHIASSRRLLAAVGGQGFPTFALEGLPGQFTVLDMGSWLGRPQAWRQWLAELASPPKTASAATLQCGPDGCTV